MKKVVSKAILLACVFAAAGSYASPLIVPKTSDATIVSTPLKTGEVAYKRAGDCAVSMAVGDGGMVKPVVDPMAVRGYSIGILPRSEMSLSWDELIVYNSGLDEWNLCGNTFGVTNRIVVTCRSHVRISDVQFDIVNQSNRLGNPPCGNVWTEINGNVAVIYAVKNESGTFTLSDLAVYETTSGDKSITNDFTRMIVPTVDSMGTSDLGSWREWAYNCRAGELAHNWSKYASKQNVRMANGNGISFDLNASERDRYQVRQNNHTNLVVWAGDTNAVEVSFRGLAANSIRFLSVAYSNATDTAHFGWNVVSEPSAFNLALLQVQYKQALTNATWTTAANAVKTRTTIRVPNVSSLVADVSQCYWRLLYNGTATRELKTTLNCDVYVNGQFFLKGTDGQIYGIQVSSGGVITATPINQ